METLRARKVGEEGDKKIAAHVVKLTLISQDETRARRAVSTYSFHFSSKEVGCETTFPRHRSLVYAHFLTGELHYLHWCVALSARGKCFLTNESCTEILRGT